MTPEEKIAFAELGKAVIKNAAYQTVMTERKAAVFNAFCSTGADQQEEREECWRTMRNLLALEKSFERILTTGKMADEALKAKS